jgi:hypothetical protein
VEVRPDHRSSSNLESCCSQLFSLAAELQAFLARSLRPRWYRTLTLSFPAHDHAGVFRFALFSLLDCARVYGVHDVRDGLDVAVDGLPGHQRPLEQLMNVRMISIKMGYKTYLLASE